ncbi:MAG: N-acetylmuramoyl-L-alanine amidase [Armatimonadetes bacterium]|nr:N-acetylmuramoyl-L-alanine amidase [Armatimonadota bacterium]
MVPFTALAWVAMIDWNALSQQIEFTAPGRNNVAWVDSPNFNARPEDAVVDTIVLHHTASPNLAGTVKWFTMPESQVSAHFTVGKDGSIVQMVSCVNRAWHAGASKDYKGRENVNNFSIGIEIVNVGDGKDPYPPEQISAVRALCQTLIDFYPIRQITSHEFIAEPEGRKDDPIDFPWSRFEDLGVPLVFGRKSQRAVGG